MNEFCTQIAEILEVDEVRETDELADFPEWDSLSVLSVISMLDASYGVIIHATDLKKVQTVADLWKLANSRRKP